MRLGSCQVRRAAVPSCYGSWVRSTIARSVAWNSSWRRCPMAPVHAAQAATWELNAAYLTVMLEGRYTDAYLERPARRRRSSPRSN
jgi:hypothetical protein